MAGELASICLLCSAPSNGSICRACRARPVRVACQHCQEEWHSTSPSGNEVCQACYSALKSGPARRCQFCCLNAAFGGATICRRCLDYRSKSGPPSICQSCGLLAAFPRTTRQLERTKFQLLCFICTRNYKRRYPKKRTQRGSPASVYSPQRSILDVISVVFTPQFLPYLDLSHVAWVLPVVCKAFRDRLLPPCSEVLRATKFRSLTLSPKFDSNACLDRLLSLVGSGVSSVRKLSLSACARLTLSDYLPQFTGVVHLDLTGCTFESNLFNKLHMPLLITLRVGKANRRVSASSPGRLTASPSLRLLDAECSYFGPDLVQNLSASNKIELLDLSNTNADQSHLSLLRHIRYLDLSNVHLSANCVPLISQEFQNLQYLNIRGSGAQFGSSHLRRLLQACKLLQTLDISGSNVDENGFADHHELKSLYMHNCRHIPKRPYLSALIGHFSNLTSLDISHCINTDDDSLASLGNLSVPLKSLNVGSLVKLSVKSISVLAKQIPGLSEIKIGGAWFLLQTDRIDERIKALNPNLKLLRHNPDDDAKRVQQFHHFF